MKRAQLQILFHGLIVLLIGLLCGVPFGQALTKGWGEEAVRAWRLAHLSLTLGGVWLVAVAGVTHLLVLSRAKAAAQTWSFVVSGYGFVVASVVAAVGGVRGLQPTGPALNLLAFAANTVAVLASLVGVTVMVLGAYGALRATERR